MRERLDGVLTRVGDRALVEDALDQLRRALDERRAQLRDQRRDERATNLTSPGE
jgi:hypothetical protein